jgi:ketosteroid isomerase-like protein
MARWRDEGHAEAARVRATEGPPTGGSQIGEFSRCARGAGSIHSSSLRFRSIDAPRDRPEQEDTMHKNADLIRRGYQAFNTADLKTLAEVFDENASWHTPGRSPVAGDRVGRDAVFAHFGRYGAETAGTFRAELLHVCADDDGHAVGIHHNTGMRNGKRLNVLCCIVFEIKDNRAVSGREFFYDLNAWDAFWS